LTVLPRLKLLNALTVFTPPVVLLSRPFAAKGIYFKEPRSGFEPGLSVNFMTADNKSNRIY
jgi:hypothetical protein